MGKSDTLSPWYSGLQPYEKRFEAPLAVQLLECYLVAKLCPAHCSPPEALSMEFHFPGMLQWNPPGS